MSSRADFISDRFALFTLTVGRGSLANVPIGESSGVVLRGLGVAVPFGVFRAMASVYHRRAAQGVTVISLCGLFHVPALSNDRDGDGEWTMNEVYGGIPRSQQREKNDTWDNDGIKNTGLKVSIPYLHL